MGCGICGDPSHNRLNCNTNLQKLSGSRIPIHLEATVCEKLKMLGYLCRSVADELGKGHTEKTYQEALSIELQQKGIVHIMEQVIPIQYKGIQIGGSHCMRIDICLETYLDFIYELKATATSIKASELWQVLRYLKNKKYTYGAVVNFNQSLSGRLDILFVVKYMDEYYLFDLKNMSGVLLNDFVMESAIDVSPCLIEDE
jgi:GxxExxY protein